MLGILKRTCTQLTDMKARRTLYLTQVKSQLCYSTEVWSPVNTIQLSKLIERVQRRATRWIMIAMDQKRRDELQRTSVGVGPFAVNLRQRGQGLGVSAYKALFGYVNVDVSNCVSFVSHGRTRLSNTSKYILQSQICRTTTFKSSYYNRVDKLWNIVCKDVCLDIVSSPSSFKCLVKHIDTLVLFILFMMLTCHVRGPCFVTVRVIGRKLWCTRCV